MSKNLFLLLKYLIVLTFQVKNPRTTKNVVFFQTFHMESPALQLFLVYVLDLCDKVFKYLQMPSQQKIGQHSGHVFACKGCGKTFNQATVFTDTISLCVASLTTQRVFATSVCGARTTNEEIILNLSMLGEEERKRIVLASSRKRADIIYPFKWKSIVLVFNKLVCMIYVVSQDF